MGSWVRAGGALIAAVVIGALGAGCNDARVAQGSAGAGGFNGQGGAGGHGFGGSFGGAMVTTAGLDIGGSGGGGATGLGGPGGSGPNVTELGDSQTPPMGDVNMTAWLASGSYKSWSCEAAPHPSSASSAHGTSRACANNLMSGAGPGEYPVGAASVLELYDDASQLHGYCVSRHVDAGADPGSWYWFSAVVGAPAGDGLGYGACATCHREAGTNGATGHDYVFDQVR
jgi:hypothetical protein